MDPDDPITRQRVKVVGFAALALLVVAAVAELAGAALFALVAGSGGALLMLWLGLRGSR